MRTIPSLALVLALMACAHDDLTDPFSAAAMAAFPDVIALPDGFWPEGITFGRGSTFYVGSLATGAIFRGDARTGTGSYLVAEQAGRMLTGMKYDAVGHRLVVGGGLTGEAYLFNASTGAELAVFQLGDPNAGTLVNDVALAGDVAYFTDSYQPVLYRVSLGASATVQTVPLRGDFIFDETAELGNNNGIVALPGGNELLIVNMADGALYVVNAQSGHTARVELHGEPLFGGDGMLLIGNLLYVVQGHLNQITQVRLSSDFRSATVTGGLTSADLQFPATIAALGSWLYAVNARFDVEYDPSVQYSVARVAR